MIRESNYEVELLKLIFDYANDNKILDSSGIEKIIEIVVNNEELDNYVRNLIIMNNLSVIQGCTTYAAYDPLDMNILVDFNAIKDLIKVNYRYKELFNGVERRFFYNLVILQVILHELEHAFQYKVIEDKQNDSTESLLLKASLFLSYALKKNYQEFLFDNGITTQELDYFIQFQRKLYKKYYDFVPSERLAQINSYKMIKRLTELLRAKLPRLYEFYAASFMEQKLKGYLEAYKLGGCPTKVYLFGVKKGDVWTKLDFYDQNENTLMWNVENMYDLSSRMALGLPVSLADLDKECDKLLLANKYRR